MITIFLYYTALFTVVLGQTLKPSTNHSLELKSASKILPECPQYFVLSGNLKWCYRYHYEATFLEAVYICAIQESILAEPRSPEENAFIFGLAKNHTPMAIWIGILNSFEGVPRYISDNGLLEWTNWYTEDKPVDIYDSVKMFVDNERGYKANWGYNNESEKFNYVCQARPIGNLEIESRSQISPICPKDFVLKESDDNLTRCYKYSSDPDTFLGAVFACQGQGSILAEPRSPKENANIFGSAKNIISELIWIGITDNNTERVDKYHSDNRSLVWERWNPFINHTDKHDYCVTMFLGQINYYGHFWAYLLYDSRATWVYDNCSTKYNYICQASPIEKEYGENETGIKDKSTKPEEPNYLLLYGGVSFLILALLILAGCVCYFVRKRKKSVSEETEEQTEMTYTVSTMYTPEPNTSKTNTSEQYTSEQYTSEPYTSYTSAGYTSKPYTSTTYTTGDLRTSSPEAESANSVSTKI